MNQLKIQLAEQVEQFRHWSSKLEPKQYVISAEHIQLIQAAAERLARYERTDRQREQARINGSKNSDSKGKPRGRKG